MAVESKMGFFNDVETKFDRTFKNSLRYGNGKRGNASKNWIDFVCRGNFFIFLLGYIWFACGCREGFPSKITLNNMKESAPVQVALFAKAICLEGEPVLKWWIPYALRKAHQK